MQIGFIGTGTMGTPIAGCLIDAGHRLTVFDIRSEATQVLVGRGADSVDSPRAVAEHSEVVFTSLPGPDQMEPAVLDPITGILAGLRSGTCLYRFDHQCTRGRAPGWRSMPRQGGCDA